MVLDGEMNWRNEEEKSYLVIVVAVGLEAFGWERLHDEDEEELINLEGGRRKGCWAK